MEGKTFTTTLKLVDEPDGSIGIVVELDPSINVEQLMADVEAGKEVPAIPKTVGERYIEAMLKMLVATDESVKWVELPGRGRLPVTTLDGGRYRAIGDPAKAAEEVLAYKKEEAEAEAEAVTKVKHRLH